MFVAALGCLLTSINCEKNLSIEVCKESPLSKCMNIKECTKKNQSIVIKTPDCKKNNDDGVCCYWSSAAADEYEA